MKIFTSGDYGYAKTNFVDKNNVLLGYSTDATCCEDAGWFIASQPTIALIHGEADEHCLDDYDFDTSFFQEEHLEKEFEDGGIAIFRITNGESEKFIHLFNCHNGYYSHGFDFESGGQKIKEGSL